MRRTQVSEIGRARRLRPVRNDERSGFVESRESFLEWWSPDRIGWMHGAFRAQIEAARSEYAVAPGA